MLRATQKKLAGHCHQTSDFSAKYLKRNSVIYMPDVKRISAPLLMKIMAYAPGGNGKREPVVAVDEGGYLETVTDETGLLVQPDVEKIRSAIRIIAKDPVRYREQCFNRAKKFDSKEFRNQIIAAINTCSLKKEHDPGSDNKDGGTVLDIIEWLKSLNSTNILVSSG